MADRLISQLVAGGANLQDADQIEGQKTGEVQTKRFTGLQMRGVEKAEREAQDDQIELSAGLNADGTFTPPANSWGLRAVDFANGCTDRAGATGVLTQNILNGLRLLDARVQSLTASGHYIVLHSNLTVDTTLTDLIPAGFLLQYIILIEKSGNETVLDLGTSIGGNEVFLNQTVAASSTETVAKGLVYSMTAATTLYLNDDDASSGWNGATVDAYFVMIPIIPSAFLPGEVVVSYHEGAYNFSTPPTEAELEAVLGDATDYAAAAVFIVNDTDTDMYFIMSNGVNWYYNSAIFDEAL